MTPASTGTHTVAYVTDAVMGTVSDILALLDVAPTDGARWDLDYGAIAALIESQQLDVVVLECHQPDGSVRPVFEFSLSYAAGGPGRYRHSRAAVARYWAKVGGVAPGTVHRLFHVTHGGYNSGGDSGAHRRAPTQGLHSTSLGFLAEAPQAQVALRHLR